MICENCKASIHDDAVFCPFCGQRVAVETVPAPHSSGIQQKGASVSGPPKLREPAVERKTPSANESGLRFSSNFKRVEAVAQGEEKLAEQRDLSTYEKHEMKPDASKWFVTAGGLDVPTHTDCDEKTLEIHEQINKEKPQQLDVPVISPDILPTDPPVEKRSYSKDVTEAELDRIACAECEPNDTSNTTGDKKIHPESTGLSGFLRKHKGVLLLGAVACCVLLLVIFGRAGKASTSERLIKEDITKYCADFLGYNDMNVVSIEIIDQKTDSKNNTDEVYVEMVTSNTICRVTKNFAMQYYKYNDGWRLEDVQTNGQNVEILSAEATETDARMALLDSSNHDCLLYGDISFSGRDTQLEYGTDVFYYTITLPAGYCTENYTASVVYSFVGCSWELDSCQVTQEAFTWDILGQWHYNAGDANIWVNIISQDQNEFELEFSIQYNYSGWYNSGQRILASDGIVEVYGYEDTDIDGYTYLKLELNGYNEDGEYVDTGWIKVYPYSGLSWDDIGASGGPFYLELGEGIHNSSGGKTNLSDLFALEIGFLDYMDDVVTDIHGNVYDGYFDLESYIGIYRFDTEIRYDLNEEYTNFSGTYFCDPENNDGDTIRVEIYCDNELVYTTGELTPDSPVSSFSLDVTKVKELKIWARSDSRENLWDDNYHYPSVFLVDAYVEK